MQSWMGSDFTNDDLVKQSSPNNDFTHELIKEESMMTSCVWKNKINTKPNAAVVWGSILTWIDKKNLHLKQNFTMRQGELVNTMLGKNIKSMEAITLPTLLEVIPAGKKMKTMVEQLVLDYTY